MDAIFHRTSIRKYQDKPVEKEKIMQIRKRSKNCSGQRWQLHLPSISSHGSFM